MGEETIKRHVKLEKKRIQKKKKDCLYIFKYMHG